MKSKSRVYYVDFIRVFAICMVIILHCICDYFNNATNSQDIFWYIMGYVNELTRIGVPLFFMISGFLLLSSNIPDVKNFYKHRFMKLCVPFIIYDIFYYIVFPGRQSFSIYEFLQELFNSGSSYHLWFMYSILFLYLLLPFIKKITDNCSLKMLLLFFTISIFQTTIRPFINTVFNGSIYLFVTDDGISGYLGYMLLGYILGKYEFSPKTRRLIYLAGLLSYAVFPLISMHTMKATGSSVYNGGYFINHYIEAASFFVACKQVIRKDNKFFSKMSTLTMDAYFIHVFVIDNLKKINFGMSLFVIIPIYIVASILLSFFWAYIVSKIKILFQKKQLKRQKEYSLNR